MVFFRSFVFLLLLYLLQGSNTSLVQLNNNGYEGIIIAIDPGVPENETLIERIKDMVTSASTYLFEATEKRFFFKSISILIPETWKENPQYKRPKHESYKHADVLVTLPALPGRDEPYTKQFRGCEGKGEHIHFTPDFVLGKKQNEYGPTGKNLGSYIFCNDPNKQLYTQVKCTNPRAIVYRFNLTSPTYQLWTSELVFSSMSTEI